MARRKMKKAFRALKLGDAVSQVLEIYSEEVTEKINAAGNAAMKDMVKKTQATAPEMTGDYASGITMRVIREAHGMKRYIWCVEAPDYRLTHLLAHGHATVNGGRVPGNPFLQNAVNDVLPEYERAVEEAIKNG